MALPEMRGRGRAMSGLDLRHVVAAILTLTMFVMLGNMIKQQHFSPSHDESLTDKKLTDRTGEHVIVPEKTAEPWQNNGEDLKPCWEDRVKNSDASVNYSSGFVSFSLTNGPEFHIAQVVDAVMVARYLGATLVLPDILGDDREIWNFSEIYDDDKFIKSLDGIVKVAREQPLDIPNTIAVVKVPNRIVKDSILENVKPIFENSNYIRLETYFPTINMKKPNQKSDSDSVTCAAMFSTLELRSNILETIKLTVERLRTLNRESSGKFVAVDLRPRMFKNTNCRLNKTCLDAKGVSEFLQKIGLSNDTTIYVTHSRRDSSLDELIEFFPKTYTKQDIIPEDKKEKFLSPQGTIFGKMLDYHICAQSDIFVPGISGLFYGNVAGTRIVSGRIQILVPGNIDGSSVDFVSSYVSAKNHLAYSCFC